MDPLSPQYPELTPYQFASNRPIDGVDLDGLEYYYFMSRVIDEHGNRQWNLIKTQKNIKIRNGLGSFKLKVPVEAHFAFRENDETWRLVPIVYLGQSLNKLTEEDWDSFLTIDEIEAKVEASVKLGKKAETAVAFTSIVDGGLNLYSAYKSGRISYGFRSVSRRHRGAKVSQRSKVKDKNTVFDETVNVATDRVAINTGKARSLELNDAGNKVFELKNGRKYEVMNDELVPKSGPGIYSMNRAQYKILGMFNEIGFEQSLKFIDKIGYGKDDIDRAKEVYNAVQKSINL